METELFFFSLFMYSQYFGELRNNPEKKLWKILEIQIFIQGECLVVTKFPFMASLKKTVQQETLKNLSTNFHYKFQFEENAVFHLRFSHELRNKVIFFRISIYLYLYLYIIRWKFILFHSISIRSRKIDQW